MNKPDKILFDEIANWDSVPIDDVYFKPGKEIIGKMYMTYKSVDNLEETPKETKIETQDDPDEDI